MMQCHMHALVSVVDLPRARARTHTHTHTQYFAAVCPPCVVQLSQLTHSPPTHTCSDSLLTMSAADMSSAVSCCCPG
jgi:hypothetical protein